MFGGNHYFLAYRVTYNEAKKGYIVYDKQGVDMEAFLSEGFDSRPINYRKLKRATKKEGYIVTRTGWQACTKEAI